MAIVCNCLHSMIAYFAAHAQRVLDRVNSLICTPSRCIIEKSFRACTSSLLRVYPAIMVFHDTILLIGIVSKT
uniref:Uncharacterized protein n=1 Tax=Arundo donax TaxID=35708 RepID=A0A0A9C2K2_ARUDO